MTEDRSQLINFVQKFIGTVKFGNDHVAKIMGYGDYKIGNVTILRVYFVEGLGHNLFSVGQFYDSDLEVAFRQHTCFIRNLDALKTKSWLWHHRLSHLNFGAINHLAIQDFDELTVMASEQSSSGPVLNEMTPTTISSGLVQKPSFSTPYVPPLRNDYDLLFQSILDELLNPSPSVNPQAPEVIAPIADAEDVATACYTQNRSIIRLRHKKTPYELLHNKLHDLSFLYVFGALCYPTNDSENLGKLQSKADIGIFIGYAPTKKAFRIYNRRTRRIVKTIHVDFDELTAMASEQSSSGPDLLFQLIFDELLNPPPSVDPQAPEVIAPITEVILPVQAESTDVEEDIHDIEVAYMGNDPLFGVLILEVTSSSMLQLHEQALFLYYDAFSTSVEPKTYKDALTQSCWLEAMHEELNEFERLEVWELVPQPDKVMVITLK
nr:integrase, catalytic region, zinc finger, CCHC-type, peptidase aspartic, catalytic [Tanacetum cinerariifolium]